MSWRRAEPNWDKCAPLVQGETRVSGDPNLVISTVLGSCVSICLFDLKAEVGGINHFLLADSAQGDGSSKKYGLFAFETLLNELMKRGAMRTSIRAKVFGGARMRGKFSDLGPRNAAFAMEILELEGIILDRHDLGGWQARRLKFHPVSGMARLAVIPAFEDIAQPQPIVRAPRVAAAEVF